MLYITGDTYGDVNRFKKTKVHFKKGDTVIVCGNFGFFCEKDRLAAKSLKWLSKQKYTIAFLHGAIDNIDWLSSLPQIDWNGGKAAKAAENIYWLCPGEIYEIEGKSLFCFGGGENLDYLSDNYSEAFYSASLLTEPQKQEILNRLSAHNNQVDFILTHDAPTKLRTIMMQRKNKEALCTSFHQFLDQIWDQTKFSGWYFGKYQDSHTIAPIYHCISGEIIPLNPKKKKRH